MKSLSATLYCNRVSKTIGGKPVLNDISFSAYPGETIALIGPNGAGKTTLLKTLGGLIAPDQGETNIRGRIMNPENRDMLLRQVGMLIGIPVFERGMSVRAILHKHLAFMRCDWSPDETMERVGLAPWGIYRPIPCPWATACALHWQRPWRIIPRSCSWMSR